MTPGAIGVSGAGTGALRAVRAGCCEQGRGCVSLPLSLSLVSDGDQGQGLFGLGVRELMREPTSADLGMGAEKLSPSQALLAGGVGSAPRKPSGHGAELNGRASSGQTAKAVVEIMEAYHEARMQFVSGVADLSSSEQVLQPPADVGRTPWLARVSGRVQASGGAHAITRPALSWPDC